MRIPIKTKEEINIMRAGGRILADILETLRKEVCEGISTKYLDEKAEDLIKKYKVEPSFKNYQGYPACICSSVNEEVVHAIPSLKKILQKGDIISIDCGIIYKGFNLDSTITTYIEPIPAETKQFLKNTLKILDKAISQAIQGARVGDISNAIEKTAKEYGYSPVRELTGHGVGRKLHEPPQIPNYGKKNTGELLLP
ncbi:type I methionyl aminopeptidase, partial [Candidatus Peregrinibacteria bacterium RIFOXYC2_FULL_33_13]